MDFDFLLIWQSKKKISGKMKKLIIVKLKGEKDSVVNEPSTNGVT